MKKMNVTKLLTLTICCFMLSFLCINNAKAADYTVSVNNAWVDGYTEVDSADFYHFTLTKAGTLTATLQTYSYKTCLWLYDKDLVKEYSYFYINGSSTSPATDSTTKILEPGNYCIKIAPGYWADGAVDFRFKLAFTPANNNETEPNNTFDTAMPLTAGKKVTGLMSVDDDLDYYKIQIPSTQTVRIIYNSSLSTYFTVYNSDLMVVDFNHSRVDTANTWEATLAKGTYYIKISRYYGDTGSYLLNWSGFNYVTDVKLKKSKLSIVKGKNYSLLKSISPSNATIKTLNWTSNNTDVATVSATGKVKAKRVGVATIYAKTTDGSNKEVSCVVIVKPTKTKMSKCKVVSGRYVHVKVKMQKGISGVQYQLCRKKSFKGKTSSFYGGTHNQGEYTDALKLKKTYYIRVRSYVYCDGKKYYGAWSAKKKVKIKKNGYRGGYFAWKDV